MATMKTSYAGDDIDNFRNTARVFPPFRDRAGYDVDQSFGSAHPSGWNVVLADGSVRTMSFQVDGEVHFRLGHRADGIPIDGNDL